MEWWTTPSGTTVAVAVSGPRTAYGDTAAFYDVAVQSSAAASRTVEVRIDEPRFVNTIRYHNRQRPLAPEDLAAAAWIAALRAVDNEPGFFDTDAALRIELGYDELDESSRPQRISDHALRQYIARRLYLLWKEQSFYASLSFDERDSALTGADPDDFLRNLQLLEQEGYVQLDGTHDHGFAGFSARGTARLIRDVERYGAAVTDVESQDDYAARLRAAHALSADRTAILNERMRYRAAQSSAELASVFRAVAPLLEGVVRRLLEAHGSKRNHTNLGTMIHELTERRLGTLGVRSQLSAVQSSARDISLHGEELPSAVLRIACETCFELFPQLGVLYPQGSA
jgi:hypothetical protein